MRYHLFPALGAALTLGASGAFASIICDSKRSDVSMPNEVLSEVTKQCIRNACTSRAKEGMTVGHCGPLAVTITHLGPLSSVEDCIAQFRSIVEQCITIKDVHGGTSQTNDAVYDLSAANVRSAVEHRLDEDGERERKNFELRGRVRPRRGTNQKAPKKSQKKGTGRKAPIPNRKGVRMPNNKKPKSKKKSKTKSKTKSKVKKTKCKDQKKANGGNAPKGSKPKRTIRDVVKDYLPEALGYALLPRGAELERRCWPTGPDPEEFYEYRVLTQNKAEWHMFNSKRGWRQSAPKARKVKAVLTQLNANRKLDVVVVSNSQLSIVGNPTGGTHPEKFLRQQHHYLLTNGAFFDMNDGPTRYFPVGESSTTPNSVPIPQVYAQYYQTLTGNDGSFLHTGPSLKNRLTLDNNPDFEYRDAKGQRTPNSKLVGSLAHASQPNERVALATFPDGTRYFFALTTRARKQGLNLNGMRDAINIFLQQFGGTQHQPENALEIVNIDGGGSVYVAWNRGKRAEPLVIAQGSNNDETPGLHDNPRTVGNLLRIR